MRFTIQVLFILAACVVFVLELVNVSLGKIDLTVLGLLFFAIGHLPLDGQPTKAG